MTHPSAVFNAESEVLPSHRLRLFGFVLCILGLRRLGLCRLGLCRFRDSEDTIDDTEGRLQVRVPLAIFGSHD